MAGKKGKILIVEDNQDHLDILATNLGLEGYSVIMAINGKEALELVYKENPELIIVDIWMPELDGFEFCQKIKSSPGVSSIPVIILTGAKTRPEDVMEGLAYGADAYLLKPFELEELVETIEGLLAKR